MRGMLRPLGFLREAKVTRAAILIAAVAGLLAGAQAHAQAPGYYLGISGAGVWTDAARSTATLTAGSHNDEIPNGFKVFGGRMGDRFGIEFAYYYLGNYDIVDGAGAVTDQLESSAMAVSGVYTAQVAPGYYFNAKIGLAFTDVRYDCRAGCTAPRLDTTRRGTSGLMGIGMSARVSRDIWVRTELEHIGSVQHAISNQRFKDGYDMLSVGVHVQF
jgi:hypothetical protein